MTEQIVKPELEEKEKTELLKFFKKLDKPMLQATAEAISMMVRAFEGKPIDDTDVITRLTNVKEILERSRFPTYPLLQKQVYLRLITLYHPECYAFRDWADLEAKALISYKGKSREEYVEMTKAASQGELQEIVFGKGVEPTQQPKRHFWQRKSKEEKSEFVAQ